jgi:hypothetical protein
MALTQPQKLRTLRDIFRDRSHPPTVVKDDMRAAIDATAQWLDTSLALYNAALPANYRREATAEQKKALLLGVLTAELR